MVLNEARVNIVASMGSNKEATSEQAKEGEASETMQANETVSETASKLNSTSSSSQEATTLLVPDVNAPAADATATVVG